MYVIKARKLDLINSFAPSLKGGNSTEANIKKNLLVYLERIHDSIGHDFFRLPLGQGKAKKTGRVKNGLMNNKFTSQH